MHQRCSNPDAPAYVNYGGRGITVCKRWADFDAFVVDMHPRPEGMTIERKNNKRGYMPSNCRWATRIEQVLNRRRFKNNTTGVTGVQQQPNGRFIAIFHLEEMSYKASASFETCEAAQAAYDELRGLILAGEDASHLTARGARYDSATKIRGITPHQKGGFLVRVTVDKKRKYLGWRKTLEEAIELKNAHEDTSGS